MTRPADYDARAATILSSGLPCRITCSQDGGFTRLELHPLPGWVHLADDATVAKHMVEGDAYHISLSTWPVDEEGWCRIVTRWHGVETTINIERVTQNGGAELSWTGVVSDVDIWQLYMTGSYGYKWHNNGYGLHISM
jgi:hypothetical protein